jgi:hypothetical protein
VTWWRGVLVRWGGVPNPHPNPLPEYQERGKEGINDQAPMTNKAPMTK